MRHFEGLLDRTGWGSAWPPSEEDFDGPPHSQPNETAGVEYEGQHNSSGSDIGEDDADDDEGGDIGQPEVEVVDEDEEQGNDDGGEGYMLAI